MAVVIPGRGKATETAQILLKLADHPYQVQTSTDHGGDRGVAFVIPDELHDKYLAHLGHGSDGTDEDLGQQDLVPKRRPGRPTKIVEE